MRKIAVTKIWQIKGNIAKTLEYAANPDKVNFQDLDQVLKYAADKDKVVDEGESFYAVTGINCKAETATQEMVSVQERFGKRGGNVAYHAYQSFKTGEVTAEQCHRLGCELARQMWGDKYQVLVATHFNTGTYHNHFVVNAVGMWDGKKYDCSEREYYRMRRISDEMCAREGLTVIRDPHKRASRALYFAEKNGDPTKYNLMREAIDEALMMSTDRNEFRYVMKKLGYVVHLDDYRKYGTIRSLNSKKNTRLYRLGEEYDTPAILDRIYENEDYDFDRTEASFQRFAERFTVQWVEVNPPGKAYYEKKKRYDDFEPTGFIILDVLFLLLEMALGLYPPPTPEHPQRERPLSPECREAERRLDRYNKQMILVSEHKLKTPDDVVELIGKCNTDIDEITKAREFWRNKLRNAKDPNDIAEYKKKRDECTYALYRLRLQKKTAKTILDDIPQIKMLIQCEKNCQRECDPYECVKQHTEKQKDNHERQ